MRLKKVFLFGAGYMGKEACEILQEKNYYHIEAFVDNDKKKAGTTFCEKDVVPVEYAQKHSDIPIIITSEIFYTEIKAQLDALGLENYKFEKNMYLSRNLVITEKKLCKLDLNNEKYSGNLYFDIDDITSKKVDLENIDNIIVDNYSDLEFIQVSLQELNVSKYDERLTYIAPNDKLKRLKEQYPYIMKNGVENFFPISESLYLYTVFGLNIDSASCRSIRNEIFTASIKRELVALSDQKTINRNKYTLWNEMNYQEEFDNVFMRNICDIDDSNGSRYYEKYDINIGIVCDEFLYALYKDSCNLIYITLDNYKDYAGKLDVFIVASVWNGLNKEWHLKDDDKLNAVKKIVEFYKNTTNNIKTVFYSKEDPVFYEDFIKYAGLFEYVFTTDINCVERYKKDLKKESVYNINFAVNPRYHNPIGINKYNYNRVIFSGSWYDKFKDRNKALGQMFDGIIENEKMLYIVDRNFDEKCEMEFPLKYLHMVLRRVPHEKLQKVHKLFNYAVNINTIQNSETMFANRVYELQAQGNILISNYSLGVAEQFKNVHIVNEKQDLDGFFEKYESIETLIEKQRVGIRNVMTNNTVYDRMEKILSILEVPFNRTTHKVLIVVSQNSERLNTDIEKQVYNNIAVVMEEDVNDMMLAEYDFICFFDGEYTYDEYYIQDRLNAFKYVDVDFVTQNCNDYENNYTYTDKVASKYVTMFSTKNINKFKCIYDAGSLNGFLIP